MKDNILTVVHFASGDLWAGAEVQLFTLAKHLNRKKNINVKVILLNEGELAKQLINEGLELVVFDESKLNSFQIFLCIKNQLKHWKPNLLHTHRQKENIIGGIASRLNGITSVRTVHGAAEYQFEWRKPHAKFILILDRLVGKYLQNKIISVSEELTTKLIPSFSKEKVVTVANGVDIELLSRFQKNTKALFSKKPLKIGLVGRLVPVKRIDRFIEAAALILNSSSSSSFEFLIYGDGPLRNQLQELIDNTGLGNLIILKGHKENIYQCICDLDILVITSEHEGLPMTLLESMAIGTPVISTNIGSISDVLGGGAYGTLITKVTPDNISETITSSIESVQQTMIKCVEAQKQVKSLYSANKNADTIVAQYKVLTKHIY